MRMAAAVTMEAGKSRTESIAEVQEAIDLIETYCAQMEAHGGYRIPLGQLTPEETNESVLRPFGVFGVIGPFNFPVALVTGMSAGALVAGNTVVIKPSEQTPLSGALVGEASPPRGSPRASSNIVHGGADDRPRARRGRDRRRRLHRLGGGRAGARAALPGGAVRAARDHGDGRQEPGDRGGVSADLDAAAAGIASSAYGYSGQKCSACSRAIVVDAVHDELVERLAARASELAVGDPAERGAFTGPVVDEHAAARFAAACEEAARDGVIAAGGRPLDLPGHFVAPTVVAGLPAGHRLARATSQWRCGRAHARSDRPTPRCPGCAPAGPARTCRSASPTARSPRSRPGSAHDLGILEVGEARSEPLQIR